MLNVSAWPPMVRISLRYGLIMGVLGFVLLIVLYYTNHHPFLIPVFLDFRIALFTIIFIFAFKELRDFYQQGILHFWQGMIGSFIMTFIFAIIASSFLFLFARQVPEFVQSYISLSMEQVKNFSAEEIDRIGKEVYDAGILSLQNADANFLASRYFVQSFIISFFLSIIISVILRRQPKL